MSRFGKDGCRCDWCGKFSSNENGEYTKPDGVSYGYIHAPDWDQNGTKDICEECANLCCTHCGSSGIVQMTPIPWRVRCKDCGQHWSLQVATELNDDEANHE